MPSLESRVARLERQNRTLRAGLLLTAVALVTCGGGVTSNYARVNTNSLVIVTEDERPVISLASSGTITFADPNGPVVLDAETLARVIASSQEAKVAP